jgi:hypothetical protein
MTHDELLEEINTAEYPWWMQDALRAVVELHKPNEFGYCAICVMHTEVGPMAQPYPCRTIQVIEKELA